MKKLWQTPELIVLVRSKPEEAVLTVCKGPAFTGPDSDYIECIRSAATTCDSECTSTVLS